MTFRPIPAPGYTLVPGTRGPKDPDRLYSIQLRNGFCDEQHRYTAKQLNWIHTNSGGDIVAVK